MIGLAALCIPDLAETAAPAASPSPPLIGPLVRSADRGPPLESDKNRDVSTQRSSRGARQEREEGLYGPVLLWCYYGSKGRKILA